ncbi:MAG: hypothetical protein AB8G05_18955 [Oligoflexales bacterium]
MNNHTYSLLFCLLWALYAYSPNKLSFSLKDCCFPAHGKYSNNVYKPDIFLEWDVNSGLSSNLPENVSTKEIPEKITCNQIKRVFPARSVEVWDSSIASLKILEKVLIEWIELADKLGKQVVFLESVKINKMLLESIKECLQANIDEKSKLEINQFSVFLVAVLQGEVHGLALLSRNSKQLYTRKIEYLSVAPYNLDKYSDKSFRYVGSSIVEKSLELSETITIEPGNKGSAVAYEKMGFITLKLDECSKEEFGIGALFGSSAHKLIQRLSKLREVDHMKYRRKFF